MTKIPFSDDSIITTDGPTTLRCGSAMGIHCSSGCMTRDHWSWGECVRAKRVNLDPELSDTQARKAWDKELEDFRDAKSQGINPHGTTRAKIDEAVMTSEATGVAFGT